MILLIRLLLAHLIGDFILQPGKWVAHKEQNKIRSGYLYLHAAVHFALILLLVHDIAFWKNALLLSLIHLTVDILKLYSQQSKGQGRKWFFYDQVLHLLTLIIFWYIYTSPVIYFGWLNNLYILAVITAFVFITKPASLIIKMFISQWAPFTGNAANSLMNAGEWIGYIERVLTLLMVIYGKWEVIGFLIAAKSVFRIGDVREATDKKLTEYILIGSLLSFGMAILTGLALSTFR